MKTISEIAREAFEIVSQKEFEKQSEFITSLASTVINLYNQDLAISQSENVLYERRVLDQQHREEIQLLRRHVEELKNLKDTMQSR